MVDETEALKSDAQAEAKGGREPERKGCPDDPDAKKTFKATDPYALKGPQVEPASAYWLIGGSVPRVPPLQRVLEKVGTKDLEFPDDDKTIKDEIAQLADFAGTSMSPTTSLATSSTFKTRRSGRSSTSTRTAWIRKANRCTFSFALMTC